MVVKAKFVYVCPSCKQEIGFPIKPKFTPTHESKEAHHHNRAIEMVPKETENNE